MTLYLLRHAIAAPRGVRFRRDADRPLTPEGRRKMRRIAAVMRELGLAFDVIVSSPFLRARQTAEFVAREFRLEGKLTFSEHLTPGGNARELIQSLKTGHKGAGAILLVGHEPDLSALISILVGGRPGFAVGLKKAGLACLDIATLRHGRCAQLDWLLTPRILLGR